MRCDLQLASAKDVADLLSLHAAVNHRLTEKAILFAMRNSSVYVARHDDRPIATLTLAAKKPWAIDKKYFASSKRPLYLTSMAVSSAVQRRGIGRLCLEEARRIAIEWPCDAIRLDAYDSADGAGEFYRKCGFREVGRATYRGTPLIYYEMLLSPWKLVRSMSVEKRSVEKLLGGVSRFQKHIYPKHQDLFEKLALGQRPDALFITCAVSRIDPCLMTKTKPGELFICRVIGLNIVPPYPDRVGGVSATIEYAVGVLRSCRCDRLRAHRLRSYARRAESGSAQRLPECNGLWLRYARRR